MPEPSDRDLVLTRLIAAAPEKLCRCWTEPALLVRWFTPPPWTVPHAELDVRPGGSSLVVMRGPEGQETPNRGVCLEVVPGRRLAFTDAFVRAWEPSEKPFMAVELDFVPAAGGTRYTALVRHWTVADRDAHGADGVPPGLGHRDRPACRAGRDAVTR